MYTKSKNTSTLPRKKRILLCQSCLKVLKPEEAFWVDKKEQIIHQSLHCKGCIEEEHLMLAKPYQLPKKKKGS
jgi:hypothetical protein